MLKRKLRAMPLLLAMTLVISACGGPGPIPAGVVFPSDPAAQHAGKTYSEWAVAWWRWVFAQPATHHPLLDTTGADAARGQSGDVWFLGNTFNTRETVTRTMTVPAGKALFFPLYTWEDDSFSNPATSVVDRIAMLADFAGEITDLTLTIDGQAAPNLLALRAQSPAEPFTAPLAVPDDIYTFFGAGPVPAVLASVSVDGYWAFLEPLPRGQHTIIFGGTHEPATFRATYHITVQ